MIKPMQAIIVFYEVRSVASVSISKHVGMCVLGVDAQYRNDYIL
jgi:hypothetical protein